MYSYIGHDKQPLACVRVNRVRTVIFLTVNNWSTSQPRKATGGGQGWGGGGVGWGEERAGVVDYLNKSYSPMPPPPQPSLSQSPPSYSPDDLTTLLSFFSLSMPCNLRKWDDISFSWFLKFKKYGYQLEGGVLKSKYSLCTSPLKSWTL